MLMPLLTAKTVGAQQKITGSGVAVIASRSLARNLEQIGGTISLKALARSMVATYLRVDSSFAPSHERGTAGVADGLADGHGTQVIIFLRESAQGSTRQAGSNRISKPCDITDTSSARRRKTSSHRSSIRASSRCCGRKTRRASNRIGLKCFAQRRHMCLDRRMRPASSKQATSGRSVRQNRRCQAASLGTGVAGFPALTANPDSTRRTGLGRPSR